MRFKNFRRRGNWGRKTIEEDLVPLSKFNTATKIGIVTERSRCCEGICIVSSSSTWIVPRGPNQGAGPCCTKWGMHMKEKNNH